jgi:hypothetical protein
MYVQCSELTKNKCNFFCEEKNLMHLPPFHKDTGVGRLSALASQNMSQNISKISGSADTNTQKVGGRCFADITTQGPRGLSAYSWPQREQDGCVRR